MPDPAVMKGVLRQFCRTERRRLYDLLTDRELLARFLADRDEAAFEELVCRHGPMVRAVCRRVLGPTADADDAFQAAFLVLLRKARSIRRTDLLANWLCAVAYRAARQALRRRYRLGARERTGDDLPEPYRPDDPPRDWLPLFDAALQRLPSKYREPVVLCELQGLPRPEAAKRLGLNEGTLSSRLGRARHLLRRKLSPYGFPLAVGTALAPAVVPEALTASTAAAAAGLSAASVSAVVLTEGVLTAMFASKLKAGALAGTVVLVFGVAAGLRFTGPVCGAGGPPGKDGPPPKGAGKEFLRPAPVESDEKVARLPAEFEPFQGEWVVERVENGGSKGPDVLGIDSNWRFAGDVLSTGSELKEDAARPFVVDAQAKPPAIDFTLTRFAQGGTGQLVADSFQGVYRFDPEGTLTLAYRTKADGAKRPTRFATAPGSGVTILVLRRPVPKAGRAPVAIDVAFPVHDRAAPRVGATAQDADLGKVVGAWELTDVDGQSPDVAAAKLDAQAHPMGGERSKQRWEALRRLQLLPAAGPMDLVNMPNVQSYIAYVELDATRNPKWFTLYATEESRTVTKDGAAVYGRQAIRRCGVYKLDGDKLVVCLPEADSSPYLRPTDFKGDGEGGLYLLTYQRAARNWKPDSRVPPKPATTADPLIGQALPGVTIVDPAPPLAGPSPVSSVPPAPNLPVPPAIATPLRAPDLVGPPAGSLPVPDPAPAKADVPPAPDLDRLQGVWVITQVDGKPVGPDAKRMESMEFLKDRVLSSDGTHGRVRLDEGKSPRQITVTMGKPDDPAMTGIYRLEADRLTIASCGKSPRLIPTGFESDPEAGITVMILERPKGPMPAAATSAERPKADAPLRSPTRDLQREIDHLREQLKRLEKEVKDRNPGEPAGPSASG